MIAQHSEVERGEDKCAQLILNKFFLLDPVFGGFAASVTPGYQGTEKENCFTTWNLWACQKWVSLDYREILPQSLILKIPK